MNLTEKKNFKSKLDLSLFCLAAMSMNARQCQLNYRITKVKKPFRRKNTGKNSIGSVFKSTKLFSEILVISVIFSQ